MRNIGATSHCTDGNIPRNLSAGGYNSFSTLRPNLTYQLKSLISINIRDPEDFTEVEIYLYQMCHEKQTREVEVLRKALWLSQERISVR